MRISATPERCFEKTMAKEKLERILRHSFMGNAKNLINILLSINDGVYLTDRERRIVFWNRAAEVITGYSADEVMHHFCSEDILSHTDHEGNSLCQSGLCPLNQSMLWGVPGTKPLAILARHRDGSQLAVEVSVAPLVDDKGDVIGGVEVFRDVTEKRELEEAKARFLSGVTHELRTPITVITGYLEMMMEGDAGEISEDQESFLTDCLAEVQRLEKLINDLLDLARFEATEFSVRFQIMNLAPILERVVKGYAAEAEKKGLELELHAPPIDILGDPDRLQQAFANLVANAIKYTSAGKVSVDAGVDDGWAVVGVRDTGMGMDEGELQRIFEPFYRVDDESTRSLEGSGIGLSIVRRIVESHSGEIEAESRRGEGSVFTIRLPLTPLDTMRSLEGGEGP